MPRLPHIAYNMANQSLHMKISLKTFMIDLLSSPFSTNRQKRQKKNAGLKNKKCENERMGKVGESKFVKPVAQRLVKVVDYRSTLSRCS